MTDAIIEAAARALQEYAELDAGKAMQAALVVRDYIAPLIRAAALEEAAKIVEDYDDFSVTEIAAVIRALKEQP